MFDFWGGQGKKTWKKVEACKRENCFKIGVRGGSDNLMFKLIL